ncbi:MAG: hypothetical protein HY423_04130 [Candidatus Lambdaproteobacteria bacterium]|nr:hypothetical protein [Candidatus Lambdaproteobacteria bacterium]
MALPETALSPSRERVVNLVCTFPPEEVTGLDEFLAVFNRPGVRAEVRQFRHTIQRRVRRSLGGKFSKGLTAEVTESVDLNPNEDLFGLRRMLGAIRQDPSNVLLLHLRKVKDEPLAIPLGFSLLFKTGRPILVTGGDQAAQDQLLSVIDLTCSRVPPPVAQNPSLKAMLLDRARRPKGFLSTVRMVLDLEFLPAALREKLTKINAGGEVSALSEPEVVNVCLLADLTTRYQPAFAKFREAVLSRGAQLPQTMGLFELLTADLSTKQTIEAFKAFLDPEEGVDPESLKSRALVFGHVHRFLVGKEGQRSERTSQFLRTLYSLVIGNRARLDPQLFRRCHFLGALHAEEKRLSDELLPLFQELTQAVEAKSVTAEVREHLALQTFHLAKQAHQELAALKSEADFVRQRGALRLLQLFKFPALPAGLIPAPGTAEKLAELPAFLEAFKAMALAVEDLRRLSTRLKPILYRNEIVAAEVEKSTLDVMLDQAREREKSLRAIYIVNAVSELVNFTFHLGTQGLSGVERLCAQDVARARLGLACHGTPTDGASIGLYMAPGTPPLGALQNEIGILRKAYTVLVSRQVVRSVRRATDHKINYLQQTFGENFFEVLYERIVSDADLPVSRHQMAAILKEQNVLGSLDAKGWRAEEAEQLTDEFLFTAPAPGAKQGAPAPKALTAEEFATGFKLASRQFTQLLGALKTSAEQEPGESNPNGVLWGLYKKGIFNLSRPEAREAFRLTGFHRHLQELIAKISSENYSVFNAEIYEGGVKLFVIRKLAYLLTIGSRFGFRMGEKVVRYQLVASPAEAVEVLDAASQVFNTKLLELIAVEPKPPEVAALLAMGERIRECTLLWQEFSRRLTFGLLDRVLGETVIKQLEPAPIEVKHLYYLPDAKKLCLGRAVLSNESLPFTKILQAAENVGNLQKNPRITSTTIDDFAIGIQKLAALRDELGHIAGVAEDVLDIIQNLTHDRAESASMAEYEGCLKLLLRILAKPLRDFAETDVQALHAVASRIKLALQALYNSPTPQKQRAVTHLLGQLNARRSDSHSIRLSFTDAFIIEKTSIRVMQKVQQGDEVVTRQKKVEMEVDTQYQTLPMRLRESIKFQEVLNTREHILFAPEGQKRKQVDYTLDIIETLLARRGSAITFYVDLSMLSDEQIQALATRVKPYNFFRSEELQPEPLPGMKVNFTTDPLSGRILQQQPPKGPPPAAAQPPAAALPAEPPQPPPVE